MYPVQSHWLQAPDYCHIQQVSMSECVTTRQPSRMRLIRRKSTARVRILCLPISVRPGFGHSCIVWLLYASCCLLPLVCRSSGGCGVLSGLVTTISNIRRTTGELVLVLLCILCQRYEVHIRIALFSSPLQLWRLWRRHSIMSPKKD